MASTRGGAVVLNDLEEFGLFEADEKSDSRQTPLGGQMSWKTRDLKSRLEPTAPIASRSEDCALSTQPNPQLQNRWFIGEFRRKPFQSTQKTAEDVDSGHSKECRSFDVDLHCNTFIVSRFGSGPCTGAIAPEHAAAKRGHHWFFFWSEKKGVRPHPPNPPWLRACVVRKSSIWLPSKNSLWNKCQNKTKKGNGWKVRVRHQWEKRRNDLMPQISKINNINRISEKSCLFNT